MFYQLQAETTQLRSQTGGCFRTGLCHYYHFFPLYMATVWTKPPPPLRSKVRFFQAPLESQRHMMELMLLNHIDAFENPSVSCKSL